MEHTTEEISCSTSRLQQIKNHVNIVKSSEEIGVKYMQEWEEKILEKRKARAEGRAEGETFRLIQLIKKENPEIKIFHSKFLTNWKKNLTTFNHFTNAISQNINLTTEEIYKSTSHLIKLKINKRTPQHTLLEFLLSIFNFIKK